jgi:peptidoglycan/xylan/chitin deacetylase (PgdA/CDA1 family)
MNHQKKFNIFALVILFSLLFTACSGGSSKQKQNINQKEQPNEQEQEHTTRTNPCKLFLENSDFQENQTGWTIDGESSIIDNGYQEKSLSIKNATVIQTTKEITNPTDTYQFEGYYKMVTPTDLTVKMIFLDSSKNTIFERSTFLRSTNSFKSFLLNATATAETRYIEVTLQTSNSTGTVILDNLQIKNRTCYDYRIGSSLPPEGLDAKDTPQFLVLGFDDNTRSEGINWILDLFKGKKNRDGSDIKTSFYLNTIGLKDEIEDNPQNLQLAMKKIVSEGHEIGNHTDNHNPQLMGESYEAFSRRIDNLNYDQWKIRIDTATDDIVNYLGVDRSNIKGFRTPYLMYNSASMTIIKEENFLYDCSIEDGYAPEMDGTNFRWPYQLDGGSAGHNENWRGKQENSQYIELPHLQGLWELPSYPLMIPKDSECADYGIQAGLWDRLVMRIPYLKDLEHKMTGLDYNLWSEGALNKEEVLGILKYNLDLRLKGNHAPFMIGTHSQYYTKEWADNNAPNADVTSMREALSEFINYALSKDSVRITTGENIIKWCQNPQPIK